MIWKITKTSVNKNESANLISLALTIKFNSRYDLIQNLLILAKVWSTFDVNINRYFLKEELWWWNFSFILFRFHKKTLILFTSLLKRREVKLNNPNTVLLLIIKSTFAVIYFVEIFWNVKREETAELQFGLNQCLIRVGIYPQLQSVLQTSHSDCPISDVWPQRKGLKWRGNDTRKYTT